MTFKPKRRYRYNVNATDKRTKSAEVAVAIQGVAVGSDLGCAMAEDIMNGIIKKPQDYLDRRDTVKRGLR